MGLGYLLFYVLFMVPYTFPTIVSPMLEYACLMVPHSFGLCLSWIGLFPVLFTVSSLGLAIVTIIENMPNNFLLNY